MRWVIPVVSSCIVSSSSRSGFPNSLSAYRSSRGGSRKFSSELWDLLPLVRDHVYHPDFGGSYSLKSVLPALVPEMTYEGMEVADGQAAGLAWESFVHNGLDRDEHDRIRKALLDYCGQDTLGMMGIVGKLQHVAE